MSGVLSDVVAEEVARRRREAGLTRDDLADRCAKRGLPLTTATIANIETGRRDASGKRRREVTVDELVVLADALDTVPVLLVFPVGRQAVSKYLDDADVETWTAAQWFGGHGDHPIGSVGKPRQVDRLPMRLYSDYEQARRRLFEARAKLFALRQRAKTENGDTARLVAWTEETVSEAEESLRYIAQRMVDSGIRPPEQGDQGNTEDQGDQGDTEDQQ